MTVISPNKYDEQVVEYLQEHLDFLSQWLPHGQSLEIDVTNISIPYLETHVYDKTRVKGSDSDSGPNGLTYRAINLNVPGNRLRNKYRLRFDYKILDAQCNLVNADDAKLGTFDTYRVDREEEPYFEQKVLMNRWFSKTFDIRFEG
ncbi:hypothetical protein [Glaciecola sp. 33A]|uniref:hypothetical protein n=1 Tax=Glaciecola sp. 33A TaxID=2057807 RepID=UPI000C31EBCA|nr:hypothetical protein [Glaciecola sp. 33A]PKI00224.1 hypothetical protein CXF81_18895 [Glaciecola sp. 33A]